MLSANFEKLKTEVNKLILGNSDVSKEELLKKIQSERFMGKISGSEEDYLINLLPIDTSWVEDDGKSSYDLISKKTGGISINDMDKDSLSQDEFDEWDLIQPEKKEKKAGFADMFKQDEENDSLLNEDLDFLIDLED